LEGIMIRTRTRGFILSTVSATLLLAVLGCSTDSPTAPEQDNSPNPPPTPNGTWEITVEVDPRELEVSSDQPANVTIRVREVGSGNAPRSGTTIVLGTSLGDFNALGSGLQSLVLSLLNGRADALLFAGDVIGDMVLTAQLEASVGRRTAFVVPQIEPVEANFAEAISELTVTFQDISTGNPTSWRWDFGDGRRSTQQNPSHTYGAGGSYVVTLTASKTGSEDSFNKLVSVEEEELTPSFAFLVDGLNVTFQDTSAGGPTSWTWDFGDGRSSREQHPQHRYSRSGNYVVELTVRRGGVVESISQIVSVGDVSGLNAAFSFQINGLTVTFLDTSTGAPTDWSWSFGDGGTSSAQNPTHTYGGAGSYAVTLTARRTGAADSTSAIVTVETGDAELFITAITPNTGDQAGATPVTITGQNFTSPVRVLFGGKLAGVVSVTSTTIDVTTPPGDMTVVPCDSDDDGFIDGQQTLPTPVDVTVELSDGSAETIANGFTYLPTITGCV
jgi:PKD repeat protein